MAQQLFATNSLGGFTALRKLSKKFRRQVNNMCRLRQFARSKEAFGKKRGNLVSFNKRGRAATAGTSIAETSTVPRTQFTLTQGTATIEEWGNSIPYTEQVQEMGEISIHDEAVMELRDDAARALDSHCYTLTMGASGTGGVAGKYVPISASTQTFTTNGTAGGTSTTGLAKYHAKKIVQQLKRWNVKRRSNGDFYCVLSVQAGGDIYDDLEDISQYTTMARIAAGEIGRYYGTRYVEETNAMTEDLGSDDLLGEALFFGQDVFIEATAWMIEIRYEETDFGRDRRVAWLAALGFALIWDSSDPQQAAIGFTSVA